MADERFKPDYLLIGEILRPHGIRGELRMRVMTDYPERIASMEQVWLSEDETGNNAAAYPLESSRLHQNYALLKLIGIDDRTHAEKLRALYVFVEFDQAVPLEEGEFYLFELLGLQVVTVEGETLGELIEVIETGANDVYVIQSETYGEVLIPVIDSVIVKTDIDGGRITVDLPEGLLPTLKS